MPSVNKKLYETLIRYILDNQQRFYRLAYSYTRNPEDALDAVQSAVCKALEAYEMPEVAYFMETFMESFSLTLDELK